MSPGPYEQIPLTDDEKDMLFTIFDYRRRLLLLVYSFLISLAVVAYIWGINIGIIHVDYQQYNGLSAIASFLSGSGLVLVLLLGSLILFLRTSVLPLRADIKCGVKEKIPFTVIKKQYFELSGQYYLTLDDPKRQYHVTNADTYNSVDIGGEVYLYRAPRSGYFFEENGKFKIL